jgi:hypothetical protein
LRWAHSLVNSGSLRIVLPVGSASSTAAIRSISWQDRRPQRVMLLGRATSSKDIELLILRREIAILRTSVGASSVLESGMSQGPMSMACRPLDRSRERP